MKDILKAIAADGITEEMLLGPRYPEIKPGDAVRVRNHGDATVLHVYSTAVIVETARGERFVHRSYVTPA